jgi:hypothetical protein
VTVRGSSTIDVSSLILGSTTRSRDAITVAAPGPAASSRAARSAGRRSSAVSYGSRNSASPVRRNPRTPASAWTMSPRTALAAWIVVVRRRSCSPASRAVPSAERKRGTIGRIATSGIATTTEPFAYSERRAHHRASII